MKHTFSLAAFAMIWDNQDRILLCLRNDMHIWNLPGWWLDIWESPWEGIIRETQEETWLEIEITGLSGIYNKTDHKELLFSFVCEITWWKAVCTSECAEMRYFAIDEIPENIPRRHKEIILDYIDDPKSLIMRQQ